MEQEKLNLTPRVKGIFKVNNITIEDILADKYTLYNLYCLKHLGKKSMKDIKKSFSSIGYEFKDGQKYFKKLELTYTDRERRIMKKMKNITSSNLWSWSSDMDNIQDLLLDIINYRTTVEQAREMIEVISNKQIEEKE
jgi:flagellar biosynthesis chaperone FliJ